MGESFKYRDGTCLIYIESKFCTKTITFLLDTGSEISLIISENIKDLQLEKVCLKIPKIT